MPATAPRASEPRRRGLALAVVLLVTGCADASAPSSPFAASAAGGPSFAHDAPYASWSPAVEVEQVPGTHPDFSTLANDGCPFVSRDGKTFYMASNRAGTLGGLDIWVSTRESEADGWSEPRNLGAPVNSAQDDFCPTIARDGHLLYFVSRRPGGCGAGDIYVSRRRDHGEFDAPALLPCDASYPFDAVNSPFDEFSPFPLPETRSGPVLYFSSFRPGGVTAEDPAGPGDSDVYRSESQGGVFGQAAPVPGINGPADDGQPNVRADGLELFFYSTRSIPGVSQGAADLYAATRAVTSDPWSAPVNLGPLVNSAGGETRPSLSWDGTTLYFGSTRAGSNDIYLTTRLRLHGHAP